jgi:hypothetical protein
VFGTLCEFYFSSHHHWIATLFLFFSSVVPNTSSQDDEQRFEAQCTVSEIEGERAGTNTISAVSICFPAERTANSLTIYLVPPITCSAIGQRRFQSSKPSGTTFLTLSKKRGFKDNWLSDPSTYPLIVVMCGAGALVVGMSAYYLSQHPDVQISPTKRNSLFRTWGAN